MAVKVMCPVCKSEFMTSDGAFATPVTAEQNGVAYLVPKVVGKAPDKKDARMEALREAGIDVSKLQSLMQTDVNIKEIFSDPNDKVLEEIGKGGFIRNPELFRRWICAQTFALLKNPHGWTYAVRERYNTRYVFRQTKQELELQIKLHKKGIVNDKRYTFFSFEDMRRIFIELIDCNLWLNSDKKDTIKNKLRNAYDLTSLLKVVDSNDWYFSCRQKYLSRTWLNCFKGAGAYYTLQNIIRTHGMILPGCKDMNESLEKVEKVYNDILNYEPYHRRWDIMLSVLTVAVKETKFELKY